ncbi:hypothetical protein DER46DRAFT_689077 [Fusarium sp. MPI-SDFR-AT-0072]|nr:hypothetical protein DER46DRAFT_689077 [Fusarium sp. MPI-SDFR-AT-0072]
MKGNPEAKSIQGDQPFQPKAEAKAPADIDLLSELRGFRGHIEVTDESQPPSKSPTGDTEGDNDKSQLPCVENDASSTVPGVIGTTAGGALNMTSAPGTDRLTPAPPAAKTGAGVVARPALITPRGQAALTSTGLSITPKPLNPLDRDQLQGLVYIHLFISL